MDKWKKLKAWVQKEWIEEVSGYYIDFGKDFKEKMEELEREEREQNKCRCESCCKKRGEEFIDITKYHIE